MMLAALALVASGCLSVDAGRILVGDLVRALPEFSAVPAEEAVAFAPAPGARRILTPREILATGQRLGVKLDPASLKALCFQRSSETLTPERVLAAIRAVAGGDPSGIELEDFSRGPVPRGELEFRPSRTGFWQGRVIYDSNRSVPVWARVRIRPDVERGENISVESAIGEARVAAAAVALTSGRAGETIAVRRPDSGRTFRVRITGKGKGIVESSAVAVVPGRSGAGR